MDEAKAHGHVQARFPQSARAAMLLVLMSASVSLGLLLGTQAPVVMPSGIDFSLSSLLLASWWVAVSYFSLWGQDPSPAGPLFEGARTPSVHPTPPINHASRHD